MTPVVFHPAAREEFDDAVRYYAANSPDLAIAFEARNAEYRHTISRTPLLYHPRKFSVRRANLAPRFQEWYLAYYLWRDQVVILAIAHAKRRPYYFRKRIGEARSMF